MTILRSGLMAVTARKRPPEINEIAHSNDWAFETKALADDFKRFEVEALASDTPTISIFDYIGDDGDGGGVTSKRVAGILRSIGDKDIKVEINSPGGNYFEGISIYNLFRRHPGAVRVEILGVAASAASVIAMAGDEIAIAHNAQIMIHEAQGLFMGTKTDMQGAMETLQQLDTAMCETYAARANRDIAEFEAMIAGKDVYFAGQEAVDAGLADSLLEQEAQMPVYASADDFPTDQASLDIFLAKQKMPRTARRDLFRAIKPATPRAGEPATPNAGPTDEQLAPLISAMTL